MKRLRFKAHVDITSALANFGRWMAEGKSASRSRRNHALLRGPPTYAAHGPAGQPRLKCHIGLDTANIPQLAFRCPSVRATLMLHNCDERIQPSRYMTSLSHLAPCLNRISSGRRAF